MAFPLDTNGAELAIYPQDDIVNLGLFNGQPAVSLIDYSGKNRSLTCPMNAPVFQTNIVNGKGSVYWDGTKSPLKNTSSFQVNCGFMVVKIDETTFSNYAGVLTDTADFPILVGNSGTANFYDNQYKEIYFYEFRSNDRIYPESSAPAPMNVYRIIFFRFWQAITVTGIQMGQDRTNTARKAKMGVALLGLYSRNFCESDVRANLEKLATAFNSPLADVFPFAANNDSTYRNTQAANIDFPSSGGQIAETLGARKFEADLKFAGRQNSQTEKIDDYVNAHFTQSGFLYRSFAFLPPRDYFGYATSLLEYSADGKNSSFGFKEN